MSGQRTKRNLLVNIIILAFLAACMIYPLLVNTDIYKGFISAGNRKLGYSLLSGNGTFDSPYHIYSENDLLAFFDSVNSGDSNYKGQYVQLEKDIVLSAQNSSIMCGGESGEGEYYFEGIFDGNGHSLSGICLEDSDGDIGLFFHLRGEVRNLIIRNSYVVGANSGMITNELSDRGLVNNCIIDAIVIGENSGAVAGNCFGNISNCYTTAVKICGYVDADDNTSSSNCFVLFENQCIPDNVYPDYIKREEEAILLDDLPNHMNTSVSSIPGGAYNYWCLNNSEVSLTEDRIETISSIYIEEDLNGSLTKFSGFYSEKDNKWAFVLPKNYNKDSFTATAVFHDNETRKIEIKKDGSANINGVMYDFEVMENSTLPNLMLNTYADNSLSYLKADKLNSLSGKGNIYNADGDELYSFNIKKLNGRGNDSWIHSPKKGFSLTLENEMDLFDMGFASGYNLISGYRGNSLMTYVFHRDLFKKIRMPYSPEYKLVNYYLNGEYQGVYFLTEKMEIAPSRFAISDISNDRLNQGVINPQDYELICEYRENPEYHISGDEIPPSKVYREYGTVHADISGGYLYEINSEDYDEDESRFVTERGVTYTIRSDYYADKAEIDYSASLWQDIEDAIYLEDGKTKDGRTLEDLVDLESFADQWILYELSMESAITGSVFYYKESDTLGDGKVHASFVWDSEHSFRLSSGNPSEPWIGENVDIMMQNNEYNTNFWTQLLNHKFFRQALNNEWQNKFLPALEELMKDKDSYKEKVGEAAKMNSLLWENGDLCEKVDEIYDILSEREPFLTDYFAKGVVE